MENYSYSSYPDSGDSSPRSREIEFENPPPWDVDQANTHPQNYKVKLMCSYGGKILPRPHDNQLCYVGGETKILAVDRGIKFAAIISKLSSLSENDVSFKYQLPGEDLDALISVTNDDDLEHMMQEYDRMYRASARPARLRLFLFDAILNGGLGSDSGRSESSDRDRFVEALNSGPTQAPDQTPIPTGPNNVDFLFGMEKSGVTAVVSPPPPPVPTVPEHAAPLPEFQVRPGHGDRIITSDAVVSPVEFQRQLQRLQIGEQDQQAMYRRKSDETLVGGYGGSGDYYMQKLPEKTPPVTVAPPPGYWPDMQITTDGFTGAPEQPMYMATAAAGGGAVYQTPPPMVRPVTGAGGQGYYHVPQRMGSEVYRDQPMYNLVPQTQVQQPSTLPPQPPKYVATYSDSTPQYTQVAYDSATGRQVYYTAPGGIGQPQQQPQQPQQQQQQPHQPHQPQQQQQQQPPHQPQQQQQPPHQPQQQQPHQHHHPAFQVVGPRPTVVSGGEMRVGGGLGQEARVVGSKLPQSSV